MSQNQPAGKIVKTGMTFGGFDLCHQGHINLLRRAKKYCENLVVCISSDEYLFIHKGRRPLLSYVDRRYLVLLTGYADVVDIQEMDSKKVLIDISGHISVNKERTFSSYMTGIKYSNRSG